MNVGYTSEPLDLRLTVTFDAGAGATTLSGGTLRVDASNTKSGVKIGGTAAITGSTTARLTFDAGSLPVGVYEVQALATPSGAPAQVVYADRWHIKPGAV